MTITSSSKRSIQGTLDAKGAGKGGRTLRNSEPRSMATSDAYAQARDAKHAKRENDNRIFMISIS